MTMTSNIPRRSVFFLPIIIATTTATMFPSVSTAAASSSSSSSSTSSSTSSTSSVVQTGNDNDNNKSTTQLLEETIKTEEQQQRPFVSAAFSRKEYTNSIVASRDTNISPLEVYDTILQLKTKQQQQDTGSSGNNNNLRALDVGAGAGVSTQVIYQQLGYINIDAIDWSGDAWNTNVIENDTGYCPETVKFYELDDERFVEQWKQQQQQKYDIIVFNFAVNRSKALYFCQNLLKTDGLLLAPINSQQDYWLKQTYQLLDTNGNLLWSAIDVGAWSVQFQPDVTQDTCQGIWCMPYNGFQKLR
jgi:protein-L-isoaspartate O-methyltransferase